MKIINESQLLAMYRANKPLTEIAEEFGVSGETVRRRVKKLSFTRERIPTFGDITGQRFGRLVAISPIGKDRFGKYLWWVQCDCGKEKKINASGMLAGLVLSCGCYKHERMFLGYKDISGAYWRKLEKAAAKRGYAFTVTKEEAWDVFCAQDKKCALSGVPLIMHPNNDKYYMQTASLDRIDSTKGYELENIQWVHKRVNFLKRDYDEKELLFWCNEISKHSATKLGDFVLESVKRERRPLSEDIKVVKN